MNLLLPNSSDFVCFTRSLCACNLFSFLFFWSFSQLLSISPSKISCNNITVQSRLNVMNVNLKTVFDSVFLLKDKYNKAGILCVKHSSIQVNLILTLVKRVDGGRPMGTTGVCQLAVGKAGTGVSITSKQLLKSSKKLDMVKKKWKNSQFSDSTIS